MTAKFSANPSSPSPSSGVLLVGHGTREEAGTREFMELAKRLAPRVSPLPLAACFLELAEPAIPAGVARLLDCGATEIVVAPVLLFSAGHAKRDIPAAVAAALDAARRSDVVVRQAAHLGCAEGMLQLSRRRFQEAVAAAAGTNADPRATRLIIVGRGATDHDALDEMRRFAELRAAAGEAGSVVTAFAALAEPRLETALDEAAEAQEKLIVVQPHLLFAGTLTERISRLVAERAQRHPAKRWLQTRHLGAEPELVATLAGQISAAAGANRYRM